MNTVGETVWDDGSVSQVRVTSQDQCTERERTVLRSLTKRYENATKTTFEDVIRFYEDNEPKGEYVLVISGKTFETKEQEAREAWESLSIAEHMAHYEASGMERKEAMKQVAKDRGISKRDVYQALLK